MTQRHSISTASLIAGLLFTAFAVIGLVHSFATLSAPAIGMSFAIAFTVIGLVGVGIALARSPQNDAEHRQDSVDEPR